MPTSPPADPLVRYASMLAQLHRLFVLGRAESVEADALRDQMDAAWVRLSAQEVVAARELAAGFQRLRKNTARGV